MKDLLNRNSDIMGLDSANIHRSGCSRLFFTASMIGHPAPSREGVRRTNHGRSFDRRDLWVGLQPTARLRTNGGRQGREERPLRKWKEKTLLSEGEVYSKTV
jgi:hypothetical protein